MMFFRLSNVPASLQSYINKILAKKLDIFIIVYLDNISNYIKDSVQGHIKAVSVDFIKMEFISWATLCQSKELR